MWWWFFSEEWWWGPNNSSHSRISGRGKLAWNFYVYQMKHVFLKRMRNILLNFSLLHTLAAVCPGLLTALCPIPLNGVPSFLSKPRAFTCILSPWCSPSLELLFCNDGLLSPCLIASSTSTVALAYTRTCSMVPYLTTCWLTFTSPSTAAPLCSLSQTSYQNHWIHFYASQFLFYLHLSGFISNIPLKLL